MYQMTTITDYIAHFNYLSKQEKRKKEKIRVLFLYVGHDDELWLYCDDCAYEHSLSYFFFSAFLQ